MHEGHYRIHGQRFMSLSIRYCLRRIVSSALRGNSRLLSLAKKQVDLEEMPALNRDYFVLPNNTPICKLVCDDAFNGLTQKERLYAHYLSQASWYGSLICLHQTSPESPLIFVLLHKIFANDSLANLKKLALTQCDFTEDEFKAFLLYACGVFSNMGNYKGFGDTKIVPNLDKMKFHQIVFASTVYKKEKTKISEIWSYIDKKIFSLEEREQRLGLGKKGVTTYLSSNIEKEDADFVDRYCKAKKIELWNSRLFKTIKGDKNLYEIRLASVDSGEVSPIEDFEGHLVHVTRGDYSPLIKRIITFLNKAKSNSANENQTKMIEQYIEHFQTGSLDAHKNGSRFWIKDKGPVVESYIGFIENYRDPVGVRSEFEGFVAVVNKNMSKKFTDLVERAEEFIKRLPWDSSYEKDKFLRPDFTSLDILCFGGSGIPAGINIPNYDEIRQDEGFKNVSLGNVIAAVPNVKINFLTPEDQDIFKKYHNQSFEVQVGLHELLGHGSGKLFYRQKDGKYNFEHEKVKDMENGAEITSWYEEGETYSSKFGALASAYEECRAEAVGYFLCCYPDILKIFGHENQIGDDVKYANWLLEIRAGLLSLEFYSPENQNWGQAHCHARFVLMRVAMEPGQNFVSITEFKNEEDGNPDLLFKLDRSKIDSVGKPAIFEFLKKLQMHKTTGNFAKGKELFDFYSKITPEILHWRDIIIARRQPRKILLLGNSVLEKNDQVTLNTYPETVEGVVASYVDRFADNSVYDEILQLWQNDKIHFD